MLGHLLSCLKGLAILRYPEIVRDLGERRFHLNRIASIATRFTKSRIDPDIRLIGFEPGRLELGEQVTISAGTVLAFGDDHNGWGSIRIGEGTWIGQYNNLRAGGGDVSIGAGCLISQFCTIVASNHGTSREQSIQSQPPASHRSSVTLGDDVWLGTGSTILPGTTIGTGTVIGTGAVVTRDVPDYEIWAGIPAKRIGQRE